MGLGLPHLLLILVILLVFFGPSRLPGLGKSLGEAIKGFKDGLNGGDSIDVTNSTRQPDNQLHGQQQQPPLQNPQHTQPFQQPTQHQNVSNDPNDPNKRS